MTNYLISIKADEDLDRIADHTLEAFGEKQTILYISGLLSCFESLSSNPELGRSAIEYAPRLKKYKYQAHMIFYEKTLPGVFIVRILDQRQDYKRHL